jgi:hypothetical protein
VVERFPDKKEVEGSIPSRPTNSYLAENKMKDKMRINYWKISTLVFIFLFFGMISGYVLNFKTVNRQSRQLDLASSSPKAETCWLIDNDASKFITHTPDNQKEIFQNRNIYFEYDPKLFKVSYELFNNPPGGPTENQTQLITVSSKTLLPSDPQYHLEINLNMYGIGGGCPDLLQVFNLDTSYILNGKNVTKARVIVRGEDENKAGLGDIYLIIKTIINGESVWNCPNVAGLESNKNGHVTIKYRLRAFPVNSQEYIKAEKELDKVVSSIKNFWD